MKKIILLIIVLFVHTHLQAQKQEKITTDFTIYEVTLMLHNQEKVEGVLFQVTDSTITVSNSISRYDYKLGNYHTTEYSLNQLIWVKASSRSGSGGLVGGMVGGLIGGAAGFMIGKSRRRKLFYSRINQPARGLFVGSAVGATIGALLSRNNVSRMSNSRAKTIRKLKRRAIKR